MNDSRNLQIRNRNLCFFALCLEIDIENESETLQVELINLHRDTNFNTIFLK